MLTVTADMNLPYASSSEAFPFQEQSFTGNFDIIDTAAGDRTIEYAELKEGDVVRTPDYNGIFVTKLTKEGNPNYQEELKTACEYASTSFQAFDRDHPEVFWLSGKTKLRMVTVTTQDGGKKTKETFIFFVLADKEGFTVRDTYYSSQSAIENGVQRRDAAVSKILGNITGTTVYEKVRQLNRWLTEHNQYNTSADLYSIPNTPHECISALEGNSGTKGPVCDGYSRAFMLLCNKLDIPCVLVDGYAVTKAGEPGEFHMWNSVKMPDGQWYGVDVTWNDPTVKGVEGPLSGYEREDFLLVGADTMVFGLRFADSHPPKNRAANGGVAFVNGPSLSIGAFNPLAGAALLPFTDIDGNTWCYGAVEYVFENGLMQGVSATEFASDLPMTRAMAWAILARWAGADTAEATPWYAAAQSWVAAQEISDGQQPTETVTREQLAVMLWRAAGSPDSGGNIESFHDSATASAYAIEALCWAVESGILTGRADGTLQPQGIADRGQVAAMLERFAKKFPLIA